VDGAATPRAVGAAIRDRLAQGRPILLATLVAREGHAYHVPGAQLAIDPGDPGGPRPVVGRISGGCVEDEVAARGRGLSVGARRFRLDTSDDGPYGLGMGCGGVLDIVVEAVRPDGPDADAWRAWADAAADGRPAWRWLGPDGTAAWRSGDQVAIGAGAPRGSLRARLEAVLRDAIAGPPDVQARLRPVADGWLERAPGPPRLWVVGLDADARAVARTAGLHGWSVELVASSRARLDAAADALARVVGVRPGVHVHDARSVASLPVAPDDRLLAASHRLDLDAAAVAVALAAGARWVGAVASARRRALLEAQPPLAALDPRARERLEAPAGLDLGARGAEEVGAAIVARLVQDLRDATRPVWAVVPAAGAGRRMGGGKPLLSDGRETLIGRAVRLTEAVCDGTIVVTGNDASRVAAEAGPSARVVHAEGWRDGLAVSLGEGLLALPAGARALVILPDMPGVDAKHLAALRAVARRPTAEVAGAASVHPDGRLGAPALLPDDVVVRGRDGGRREEDVGFAAALQAREDLLRVPLAEAFDLDTPEQAARHGWAPRPPDAVR
jgi:xanthine/CO dehydrogenase XdhC/CoxF family maturation factor